MSMWVVLIGALVVTLVVGIFMLWNVIAILRGAPYVPSLAGRIDTMCHLAAFSPTDVVLDVGSGDGRIVRRIAPSVRTAIGVEINPVLVWYARIRNIFERYTNVQIVRQNFWTMSLAPFDVLCVYCINGKMSRLEEKILREMRPGSRIVSNGFTFPTLKEAHAEDGVHVYILS